MSLPSQLWQVSWREHAPSGTRSQERRYRKASRAARQVAAIVAAPDDVAELVGVWASGGRIEWVPVDVEAMLDDAAADPSEVDDDEQVDTVEWFRRIRSAWRESA